MDSVSVSAQGAGRRRDVAAGWLVSTVLHGVALVVFVLAAWPAKELSPVASTAEHQVGVILPEDRPTIEVGNVGEVRLEPLTGEVAVPRLTETSPIEPITQVSETSNASTKLERIISIDIATGADAPGAMQGDWTSFAGGAGGEGAGGASFFGLEAAGRKFVFIVDRSGSMTGVKLDAAKAELIRAVRALPRGTQFCTVFFNTTHTAMPSNELARATESNKRAHFAWVSEVRAGGNTNPGSALKLALSLKPDVIWLLSDGIFDDAAADAINHLNAGRKTQIHTIAFYSRRGEAVLRRIAAENRGRYRFVSPASIGLGTRR